VLVLKSYYAEDLTAFNRKETHVVYSTFPSFFPSL